MPALSVGVVLDSAPKQPYHVATLAALEHAAAALSITLESRVIPSDALDGGAPVESYAAIVVGPGSPYRNPEAVLACSLDGQQIGVDLTPGSRLAELHGELHVREFTTCNNGLAPDFSEIAATHGLRVTGAEADGSVRGRAGRPAILSGDALPTAATLYPRCAPSRLLGTAPRRRQALR